MKKRSIITAALTLATARVVGGNQPVHSGTSAKTTTWGVWPCAGGQ